MSDSIYAVSERRGFRQFRGNENIGWERQWLSVFMCTTILVEFSPCLSPDWGYQIPSSSRSHSKGCLKEALFEYQSESLDKRHGLSGKANDLTLQNSTRDASERLYYPSKDQIVSLSQSQQQFRSIFIRLRSSLSKNHRQVEQTSRFRPKNELHWCWSSFCRWFRPSFE